MRATCKRQWRTVFSTRRNLATRSLTCEVECRHNTMGLCKPSTGWSGLPSSCMTSQQRYVLSVQRQQHRGASSGAPPKNDMHDKQTSTDSQ